MSATDTSIYEQERRAKLNKLRELGVDPYGQRTEGVQPLAAVKALYTPEMGHDGGPVCRVSGRIVLKRDMGKLSFLTLRDDTGDLQIGIDRKRVDDQSWDIRNLLDLADRIVVEGPLGTTNKGETTVWATKVQMAAKSLLSPPAKYEGLQDVDQRYRQRYVDLWSNPEVMDLAKKRMAIVDAIRDFFRARGFLEVETPMLQTLHGGAAARPFVTHHNALDMRLFMRIAPELFLKRLLVGGLPKVFEINRNFRNEGVSPRHNPEFTMLEAYEAFGDCRTMAELVEDLICTVAEKVIGTLVIPHANGKTVDLSQRPWRRATMAELVEEKTGWHFKKSSIGDDGHALSNVLRLYDIDGVNALARRAAGLELFTEQERQADKLAAFETHLVSLSPAEQLTEVYEKLVETTLINPVFVTRVPSVVIPLAKTCADDPYFSDTYELAINGQEISPGYTELNDPDVQAENFRHQVGDKAEQQQVDEDFLSALKYGMPPAGGIGLGIDRLVMMLTGAESIRDVILFPLMRPE
ncbi:MAG TPA: lysine--tRNA ligase [Tepidisphaeraceae bacterium]|jgi:lysyl-tRNA synthetase class 2